MTVIPKEVVYHELVVNNDLLVHLNSFIRFETPTLSLMTLELIDKDLLEEIKHIVEYGDTAVYFGKTLRDIKCVLLDDSGTKEHEIFIYYRAPKKLVIISVALPHTPLQEKEYSNLKEIILTYKDYIHSLSSYFYQLGRLDRFCTVMEPLHPTFKDDFRRIMLDSRTWLHVEVTAAGLAKNIHLVGQSDYWQEKLQDGLLTWDHDKDIVDNILTVFDLTEFPTSLHGLSNDIVVDSITEAPSCGICLCEALPDDGSVPLPLCQNPTCGVYFHRNCLYQWLVACSGSRPPAFGVANGACPTCLLAITCSEKDS